MMNQKIRELAEQAGFQYIKDENIGWAGNYNSSLPKFAELIVESIDTEAIRLIKYIANDYHELSHHKIEWQRNDYVKRCQQFLKNLYSEGQK